MIAIDTAEKLLLKKAVNAVNKKKEAKRIKIIQQVAQSGEREEQNKEIKLTDSGYTQDNVKMKCLY